MDRRFRQPIRNQLQFSGRFLRAVHNQKIDNQLRILSVPSKDAISVLFDHRSQFLTVAIEHLLRMLANL